MFNLSKHFCLYTRLAPIQMIHKPISCLQDNINSFLKRSFCDIDNDNKQNHGIGEKTNLSEINNDLTHVSLDSKYKIFQESEASILLDVYEEKVQLEQSNINLEEEDIDEFYGLSMTRGIRGVFDVQDLVQLLTRDKAQDMFVVELPAKSNYVDHIVIVTGRSRRHMIALAEFVRRVFKKKRVSTDILPRIEGQNSSAWIAIDLGNIALHIFSEEARKFYDLESLWTLGPEFDPNANEPDDPLVALMKQHTVRVEDLTSKGHLLQ